MYKKIFCAEENDGLLEGCQEIIFLFDSNCKDFCGKENKSYFFTKLQRLKIFIQFYRMIKKCWSMVEIICFK